MSKPTIQFNDYVSLAVMLLMIIALIGGQTDARGAESYESTEPRQFRGEDE